MVRITQLLLRRGHFREIAKNAENQKHIKHGPVKWRDYKSPFRDPPYWYKWTLESPYTPSEQAKIRGLRHNWYKYNYQKIKYIPPDEWLIHVGDEVQILAGKDKGKKGEVIQVVPQRNWVVVGGLNVKYVEDRGEMTAQAQPLEHDEVKLLDPVDKEPTDIEFKANDKGALVRVSTRSGHTIAIPPEKLYDGKLKIEYVDQSKDTDETTALARTYVPTMKSPEEDLRRVYKINDPPEKEMFWY